MKKSKKGKSKNKMAHIQHQKLIETDIDLFIMGTIALLAFGGEGKSDQSHITIDLNKKIMLWESGEILDLSSIDLEDIKEFKEIEILEVSKSGENFRYKATINH